MFFLEYICSLFEFSSGVYKISLNLCFYAGISEGIFLQKEGRIGLNSYLTKSIIYIKKNLVLPMYFFPTWEIKSIWLKFKLPCSLIEFLLIIGTEYRELHDFSTCTNCCHV